MKATDAQLALAEIGYTVRDEFGTEFRIWSLAPVQSNKRTGMKRDPKRTDFAWVVKAGTQEGLSLVLADVPEAKILSVVEVWDSAGRQAA